MAAESLKRSRTVQHRSHGTRSGGLKVRYRIKNWRQYQHYKGRRPPWIKVHKDILTSDDWVCVQDASKLLFFVSMMAAQLDKAGDGSFNGNPDYLKKICCLDSPVDMQPLVASGFLVIEDDASNTLAKSKQSVLSSVSLSVSVSDSVSEGGVGETNSTPDDFEAPPAARREPDAVSFDHLRDYEPSVAEPARQFWQSFCVEHHGENPIRSLHLDSTRKELRHFAGSIAKHGQRAVEVLTTYYHSPPKEDKGLSAYAVLCKLGISASVDVEPPWESAKKKAKAEAKEKLRRAIRGEAV